ncbi:MAG: hypothetical protein HPY53_02930 [Brevinematales bacterium]|nr:hypothetical protein [Brevinematales bacterium]
MKFLEDLIASFYFWLITALVVAAVPTIAIMVARRGKTPKFPPVKPSRKRKQSKAKGFHFADLFPKPGGGKKKGGSFSEKIGQQVVDWMIDVSRSVSREKLRELLSKITKECNRLSALPLPDENKRIISTVLIWSNNFDIEKHVNEMTLFHNSTQIVYDSQKRDFKLMIVRDA